MIRWRRNNWQNNNKCIIIAIIHLNSLMRLWHSTHEPDTTWAKRVLIAYGYIRDTPEACSNQEIIDTIFPMVDALRHSIKDSVEIYMRIPVWGELRDEDFDNLIDHLTHRLEIYWRSDNWGTHIGVPLDHVDRILTIGTIYSRLKNITWVIGESHGWDSRLLDNSDFNLMRRIQEYRILAHFLDFFEPH